MRIVMAGVLAALATFPSAAEAQEKQKAPVVFLRQVAVPGEIQATLVGMDDHAVTLRLGGREVSVPWTDVERLDKRGDRLADGAAIGALVGGIWCAIVCGQGLSSSSELPLAILANAGFGALIGTGIDAAHAGRTRIHPAATGTAGAAAAGARPAVAFRVRF